MDNPIEITISVTPSMLGLLEWLLVVFILLLLTSQGLRLAQMYYQRKLARLEEAGDER